ncbi:MAG: hypothetical protein WHS46_10810 [Desulfosoma sp.]
MGYEPHQYAYRVDVGKTTTVTLSNLPDGSTLYFAATAYNTHGEESTYSEQIIYRTLGDSLVTSREKQRLHYFSSIGGSEQQNAKDGSATTSVDFIQDSKHVNEAAYGGASSHTSNFSDNWIVFDLLSKTGLPITSSSLEIGIVTVNDAGVDVFLNGDFQDPVMVAFPISRNDSDPFSVRIEMLQDNKARLRLVEWDSKDGWHDDEDVAYIAVEAGHHHFQEGLHLEAAKIGIKTPPPLVAVSFSESFENIPVVFAQVCDQGVPTGSSFIQVFSVSNDGFMLLFEDSLKGHGQQPEGTAVAVCYLAIEPVSTNIGGVPFEVDHSSMSSYSTTQDIPFYSEGMQRPLIFFIMPQQFISRPHPMIMAEYSSFGHGHITLYAEGQEDAQEPLPEFPVGIGYFAVGAW